MEVFVLLFNVGTDNEGIHTLKVNPPDGEDMVLAFEAEDDATRFAVLLEAQDFLEPTVEPIDEEEIKAICSQSGLGYKFVPEGQLEIPPEQNMDATLWQENQKPEPAGPPQDNLDDIRRQLERLLE
ncbi:hypothetical protein C1752_02073 [Acaryochloris thomasi RCC1774]|uniref:DUF3110 domain-containing protein n=1 Tax=Acaryochloris thomasi RCC1774 TaxID=1764569 RepID=A0A2W1JYN8_9CYAN|nr:DUF3110 domain-containing protein [Acaryochloris thomasi]PZD73641.1 hypothetical protein C1752_02073 [Acaryochloris thomasi RCC1774]